MKGKRNYEDRYFSATTGGHVVFESHLERDYLITVDSDPAMLAVAAQPSSGRGTTCAASTHLAQYDQKTDCKEVEE